MNGGHREPETWESTLQLLQKSYGLFRDLNLERIEQLQPSDNDRRRFSALLGFAPMDGPLRRSNLVASYMFGEYVAKEVRHLSRISDDLDFYHLILLADEGVMSDRKPLFPLTLLKRKADKAMRKAGLDGFYVVEVQALMNWPQQGEGRTLLGHIHVFGWMKRGSPGSSTQDIRRALGYDKRRCNLAFSCQFGADPIMVRSITSDMGCPSFWAAYLMKAPHKAKSRIPRKKEDTSFHRPSFKLRNTTKGLRPELAMRMLELFSQLPIFATVGGVGAGAAMLARCKNRLKLWDAQRRATWNKDGVEEVPAFHEGKFWKRTHKRRRARYLPFFIDGPTIPPRPHRGRK